LPSFNHTGSEPISFKILSEKDISTLQA